jgi:Fe-S-cluster containining protein
MRMPKPSKGKSKGKTKSGKTDKNDKQNEKNKPPKFKFECQKCGKCCKDETIYITIDDLDRWAADNSIFRVIHILQLDESTDQVRVLLKKDDDGYCNLYHRDNKTCTMYYSRPLTCRAFPLGFNGENYILRSKACPGLNKGTMTKELLKSMRDDAAKEFESNQQSNRVLKIIQTLIVTNLVEQSKAFMEKMSDVEGKEKTMETNEDLKSNPDSKSNSTED